MLQLARSMPLGMMLALLSGAACSAPDWPAVAGSASGGASDSLEPPASNAGSGIGPLSDPSRTPAPGVSGSVGQEGAVPISGGVSNLGEADAGSARPTSPVDAGVPTDASIEPPTTPEDPAEPEPACAGARLGGACWYLGDAELACDDVCSTHGGFAPDALPAPVTAGFRDDGLGLGCHVFTNASAATAAWWLSSPDVSPAASGIAVRITCGCVR